MVSIKKKNLIQLEYQLLSRFDMVNEKDSFFGEICLRLCW